MDPFFELEPVSTTYIWFTNTTIYNGNEYICTLKWYDIDFKNYDDYIDFEIFDSNCFFYNVFFCATDTNEQLYAKKKKQYAIFVNFC